MYHIFCFSNKQKECQLKASNLYLDYYCKQNSLSFWYDLVLRVILPTFLTDTFYNNNVACEIPSMFYINTFFMYRFWSLRLDILPDLSVYAKIGSLRMTYKT